MATTGLYNYDPTVSQMVDEALRLISVLEEGVSATATQLADSIPAFEMYIKSLGKYGLNLWAVETQSITLASTVNTYTPTNKILLVTDVVYRDSDGLDTTMIGISRQEWWNLSDKNQTGQPTQYYYDTKEDAAESKLYIWPAPSTSHADNGETVKVTGQILLENVGTAGTATLDVPQEWLETVKYGLATRLAPMFGYPIQERTLLIQEYNQMLKESLDFDTEHTSIFLTAESRQ